MCFKKINQGMMRKKGEKVWTKKLFISLGYVCVTALCVSVHGCSDSSGSSSDSKQITTQELNQLNNGIKKLSHKKVSV